ncbi:hypothetical protein KAOT1_15918 [Kordia algicida OT-1]|uniref:Uncharacterized protein n=1 Tax=Kordia algicida OT-1 TaxID=391587 RepID=A9DQL9_9FLAO|nr:hypothetical protein KAOT1_15918 [Kordia algicida OT-1]
MVKNQKNNRNDEKQRTKNKKHIKKTAS